MVAIAPRLAKAHWRRPISRAAELFTVVGLFNVLLFIPLLWALPGLDNGRRSLWFYGDLKVMPEHMPQIMSTLALLSLVLCGVALLWVSSLPDLAAIRDSSIGRRHRVFKRLANGWSGTSRQWNMLYHRLGILGAFYFMMLIFVHFLISVDFAMALVPGWIDALFPATQAHNALQAGVATVLLTMFFLRQFGGYKDYIGLDQFWALGKLLFALSLLWFWFWFSSFNVLWYGKKPNEQAAIELLMKGPYRAPFMAAFVLNFIVPFLAMIWSPVRKSIWGPTLIATGVLIGTFFDRIRIYVAAFSVAGMEDKHELHDVPTGAVLPELPDVLIWIGALAGSVLVYMLAAKVFPVVNIWEQKELLLYKVHKPFHRTEVLVLGKPD
jgi:molybdopterin-containing oxidoreductase family membrane subunit